MNNSNDKTSGLGCDIRLLQILRSKTQGRFQKVDAFCDLVDRMSKQLSKKECVPDCSRSNVFTLEFISSVSELAQDWHWHRATVRAFLDELEAQGYLKRILKGRNYIFQMRILSRLTVPVNTVDSVREIAFFLLKHYHDFQLTPYDVARHFEEYDSLKVKRSDGNDLDRLVTEHKATTIMQALAQLFCERFDLRHSDSHIFQLIQSTFDRTNPWSWTKWVCALIYLDTAIVAPEFPDIEDIEIYAQPNILRLSDFSDSDMAILCELFYYVKAYAISDSHD